MDIQTFQITPAKNIPAQIKAATLDEITRALPQGFYTTFMTLSHGAKVLDLRAHLRRLYAPAGEMNLAPSVDEGTLRERIALLVKENLPRESRIRLILTKSSGKIYVVLQPFAPLPESVYEQGVCVATTTSARHDPRIKDTGFISESAAQRKLLTQDIFEILLTRRGKILEGMTSNIYAIKGKTLITAQRGILLGITRKAVLRVARGQGLKIKYRAPDLQEKFDEAFLTSSSRGVVPIVSIDGQPVGQGKPGKWAKTLKIAYQNYVEAKSESIL